MRNRQNPMTAGQIPPDTHTLADLGQSLDRLGQPGRLDADASDDAVILSGKWRWRFLDDGLVVHCSQCTEHEDAKLSLELPPGISFNILFAGEVGFTLCGRHHLLGHRYRPVECAGFALNRPGILTRHLRKDQFVRKINLFVEKRWLASRFAGPSQREHLERMFDGDATVRFWAPSKRLERLANRLIDAERGDGLSSALQTHGSILRLLAACIGEFETLSSPAEDIHHLPRNPKRTFLSHKVRESLLEPGMSLQRIADTCNMSVSTLQRRFRASYGMTVSDYIRMRRLERARAAIICGGMSVGEAAYLAGYRHTSNFITAFKKQYAVTPAAYRQTHSHEPTLGDLR